MDLINANIAILEGWLDQAVKQASSPTFAGLTTNGTQNTQDVHPVTDNTYYLGKNDDDTPKAYKGIILKDQAGTGKYYRLEVYNDALRIVDLAD